MTAYIMTGSLSGNVAIKAVNFELRLVRIDVRNRNSSGILWMSVLRFPGGTLSGGTTVSATALRGGAPAATAQCRTGSADITGTSETVGMFYANAFSMTSWEAPLDITIPQGSALGVSGSTDYQIVVYFEELRLSWHY